LSSQFPGIDFTVTAKADSKYKIVGAASVAAKVTRDAWIEGWVFEEDEHDDPDTSEAPKVKRAWSTELGSGYPSGDYLGSLSRPQARLTLCFPDPNTKTWVKDSLEKTFGYPSIARFSWTTIKVALDNGAHAVEWYATRLR
jgi:ribonuclease H2 subunit A